MPELPEVETVRQDLLAVGLVGHRIEGVTVRWPRHIATPSVEEFRVRLSGQEVLDVRRRGKYLIFALSGGDYLLIHLKMTGQLLFREATAPADAYTHTVFHLDCGHELRFSDTRKFGRVYLVSDPQTVVGGLGPEPLDDAFTAEELGRLLTQRRGRLKSLLLNQEFLAGLGNIYADEALFLARIHPLRTADTLSPSEVKELYRAIQKVLRQAIAGRGTSVDRYRDASGEKGTYQEELLIFRRTGEPCPRCGGPVERIVVGGRSTHFCPICQR